MGDYNRKTALKQWREAKQYWSGVYEQAVDDYKFSLGLNQWDEKDRKARARKNRITLTLNQLDPYANNVVNDITQSRLAIQVSPLDSKASVDTAEVLQGIIRNIEKRSRMSRVLSTVTSHAVRAGIGWMRVTTDYANNDNFDQEAKVEVVEDFSTVFIDPVSCGTLGALPEYAFVEHTYSKDRFEDLYPDAQPISFDDAQSGQDDSVTVVEYYLRCYKADTLYRIILVEDGSEQILNKEEKKILDDNQIPYEEIEKRRINLPYVKIFILNGEEKPIDESEFPAEYIPIVPVIGKRVIVDGEIEYHSLIRQGRDSQVMFNFYKSTNMELLKLQPRAAWTGYVGSFETKKEQWARANIEDIAVLEHDAVYDLNNQLLPPPMRQQPIQANPTLMAEAENARKDIMMAIGMPEAAMGYKSNEISGVALRQRRLEGDNATFHFVDNVAESIAQIGTILVDVIPRITTGSQIVRITGEDGVDQNVPINTPFVREGDQVKAATTARYDGIYQLGVGKYDVSVDVGPSYASRNQETADKLIQLINARPDIAPVVGDVLFEVLDLGTQGKRIAQRLKSQIPPEMLEDDPNAAKLAAASTAMQQLEAKIGEYEMLLTTKAENEQFNQNVKMRELDMQREEIAIKAAKTAAEIEKMRAETQNFNVDAVNAVMATISSMREQVADIGQALEIILSEKDSDAGEMDTAETSTEQTEETRND